MNATATASPLVGRRAPSGRGATSHTRIVNVGAEAFPFLADHRVQGMALLPGSAYVEMALAAVTAADGRTPSMLEALAFERAFLVPPASSRPLHLVLSPGDDGSTHFSVLGPAGAVDGQPVVHATGRIPHEPTTHDLESAPHGRLAHIRSRSQVEWTGAALYARLRSAGNDYGPSFQGIQRLWRRGGETVAVLHPPPTRIPQLREYVLHPALLDTAIQALIAATDVGGRTVALVGCERLSLRAAPDATCWVYARLRPPSRDHADQLLGDVYLVDDAGRSSVTMTGVRLRCLPLPEQVVAEPEPGEREPTTFAVAATFTAEPLRDVLAYWFDTLGLPATIAFAPYAQPYQQLLDPASLLGTNRGGANVVLVRPEDWLPSPPATPATDRVELDAGGTDPAHVNLPDVGQIVHLNSYETEFLYDEIFVRRVYAQHGITLHDGDCVFDVGANIGMFTLFVHQRCADARVYAFEPSRAAFQALSANTSMHAPSTKLFNCGLSDADATAAFKFYRNSTLFSGFEADADKDHRVVKKVVENVLRATLRSPLANLEPLVDRLMRNRLDAEVYECETKTLSSVIRDHAVECIDLLKIDAEGSELAILSGIDDDHWGIIRQLVVEVHGGGHVAEQVSATLQRRGFEVVVEEDDLLRGTGLVNVFARRRARTRPTTPRLAVTAEEAHLERSAQDLIGAVEAFQQRTALPCIVCVCPPSPAALAADGRAQALARVEQRLVDALAAVPGVVVVTPAELQKTYPVPDYANPGGDEFGHLPYTDRFFAALGTLIVRKYAAYRQPPFKVVALDCDQTLWNGRCGETGPGGVGLDAPRRRFQAFIAQQHESGMLVCLCSRNNPADVLGVFERRPDMPLRLEHVAASRLNWQDKSANLASLSQELDLGLDGFVFIDDDPVVCAEVRAHCPETVVLQVPASSNEAVEFLEHVWAFDRGALTDEDLRRTKLYREDRQRRSLQETSPSFESFLSSLALRVNIELCSDRAVPRVAQLTQRTNQFNTTTIRRSEAQVRELVESGVLEGLTVHVTDRFGDYGLVGAMLVSPHGDALTVETLLLSCRALGRGVEHRMLARLGRLAEQRGLSRVAIAFVPTGRNQPARQFLDALPATVRSLDPGTDRLPGVAASGGAGGGLVFTLEASRAARLVFEPARATVGPTKRPARPPGSSVPGQRSGSPPVIPPSLYQRIAGELRDVDAIVRAIERRRVRPRPAVRSAFVAPDDDLERQLASLWQRVLGITQVGVDDNFFELGGTSLRAVQVMSELRDTTGLGLATTTLFDRPTIRAIATMLRSGSADAGWDARSTSRHSRGALRRRMHRAGRRERSGRAGQRP